METCRSPRKVMLVAWHLAGSKLSRYYSKYSRHDFTLPQLFACLVLRELLRLSYRKLEQFLKDSPEWMGDLGLSRAPDHNTLCRAAGRLLKEEWCKQLLDEQVQWAIDARMLRLSSCPLAIDSSMFESHHVSRHYELRRSRMARKHKRPDRSRRKRTVQSLPKLAVAVDGHSHLALSFWTGTGLGSDSPHFEKLLFDAWRRVPNRHFTVVADAGYDAEHNHHLARSDMNRVRSSRRQSGASPPAMTGSGRAGADGCEDNWQASDHAGDVAIPSVGRPKRSTA